MVLSKYNDFSLESPLTPFIMNPTYLNRIQLVTDIRFGNYLVKDQVNNYISRLDRWARSRKTKVSTRDRVLGTDLDPILRRICTCRQGSGRIRQENTQFHGPGGGGPNSIDEIWRVWGKHIYTFLTLAQRVWPVKCTTIDPRIKHDLWWHWGIWN